MTNTTTSATINNNLTASIKSFSKKSQIVLTVNKTKNF